MISVLVAIYNVENYLTRCIDSIIAQTFTDLDIILVDDCSSDNSGFICDEYAKKDSRIKVIHHQKNKGLSTVRNSGLDKAIGDYIYMMDGDDALHPQMIEILYNLINSKNYDFSMCYGVRVKDIDLDVANCQEVWPLKRINPQELNSDLSMRNLYLGSGVDIQFIPIWNKLFKRCFLSGYRFLKLRDGDAGQDIVFNSLIYQKMTKAVLLPEYLYYWYQRSSSLSKRTGERYVNYVYRFLECLNDIPQSATYYRSLCLRRMYRDMICRRHWAPLSHYQLAVSNCKRLRKLTHKEYWKNTDIPLYEKCAMELFYFFPKTYGAFRFVVDKLSKGVLPRWLNS